jgi:hypothetical protein
VAVRGSERIGLRALTAVLLLAIVVAGAYVIYVRAVYGVWSPFAVPQRIDYHGAAYRLEPDESPTASLRSLRISASDLTTLTIPVALPSTFYRPSATSIDMEPPTALYVRTADGNMHVMNAIGEPW